MKFKFLLVSILALVLLMTSTMVLAQNYNIKSSHKIIYPREIEVGAQRFHKYLYKLKNKNVAVIANQTSEIMGTHLVDTLLSRGVNLVNIMSPEHGFRGGAGAGEKVKDGKDVKTGLPIISLYGNHKNPTKNDLKNIDILLFDLQDVGLRFYTYISTLKLAMEACAENNVKLIVLDRPNPNGFYIDGPVLEKEFSSFVGMDPIPVVHGLTVGEYAKMVNGEYWLKDSLQCDLEVIKVNGYDHGLLYQLPVSPSPNLPNMNSIYLYPSLCFMEGTPVSIGRGTSKAFQFIGHPDFKEYDTILIPKSIPGVAKYPKLQGKKCKGFVLNNFGKKVIVFNENIYLFWLIESYKQLGSNPDFFTPFFDKLAGTDKLRKMIIAGKSEEEIRKSWQKDLDDYKKIRKKYLLYVDF